MSRPKRSVRPQAPATTFDRLERLRQHQIDRQLIHHKSKEHLGAAHALLSVRDFPKTKVLTHITKAARQNSLLERSTAEVLLATLQVMDEPLAGMTPARRAEMPWSRIRSLDGRISPTVLYCQLHGEIDINRTMTAYVSELADEVYQAVLRLAPTLRPNSMT